MPKPAEWKLKVTLNWCVDSWLEICGDYIEQYGMVKEAEKEMKVIFRVARAKGYFEKMKKKAVAFCKKGDMSLEEIRATNRVAKAVFGCELISKSDLVV